MKISPDTFIYPLANDTVKGTHDSKISYLKSDKEGLLTIDSGNITDIKGQYTVDKNGSFTDCGMKGKFADTKNVSIIYENSYL